MSRDRNDSNAENDRAEQLRGGGGRHRRRWGLRGLPRRSPGSLGGSPPGAGGRLLRL
jgi:hypothetical protein